MSVVVAVVVAVDMGAWDLLGEVNGKDRPRSGVAARSEKAPGWRRFSGPRTGGWLLGRPWGGSGLLETARPRRKVMIHRLVWLACEHRSAAVTAFGAPAGIFSRSAGVRFSGVGPYPNAAAWIGPGFGGRIREPTTVHPACDPQEHAHRSHRR